MLRSLSVWSGLALAWAGAGLSGAVACGNDVTPTGSSGGQGGMASTNGSGQGGLGRGGQGLGPVPDFSLPDVNETSATFEQMVSPRDYLGQISAWYFAEAS